MSKSERRRREFQGRIDLGGVRGLVEAIPHANLDSPVVPVLFSHLDDSVDAILPNDVWQEVIHHHPLEVPRGNAPGIIEAMPLIHEPVVEACERDVQLQDQEVLFVSRLADLGRAVGVTGKIQHAVHVR